MHCALLLYLDSRRYLYDMKAECVSFLEQLTDKMMNKFPPLRTLIEIDVMNLLDTFPELVTLLISEPMKLQKLFNDILFATLQCIENEKKINVQYAQVGVTLRLKSVPRIFSINNHIYKGLIIFNGLLLYFSKPESYVYHSVWSCPEDCESNEVVFHYIPKYPPKCYLCKSVLFENSGLRRCGEKVTAIFKLRGELMPKKFQIVDDLIIKLNLGSQYSVHAIVTKNNTTVWSIEKIVPLGAHITSAIPIDVEQLFQACNSMPWKFIYCLASSIGVNVCPLNCFMNLKISLILSVSSVKANEITGSNIIHVLVGGFDSRYITELMIEAAKLAEEYIVFGTSNTSSSTALIASSGGVCVLPLPLYIYNNKEVSSILSAIETEEIKVELGTTKLKSAVWAQGMDFKKMTLSNVASVFGYVCRGDYGEFSDEISDFVLQQAMGPIQISKDEIKAANDVKDYIDLVAGIEVVLGNDTENLLKSYFLAARKENSRNASVGSMPSLVATCLTSARLCRRKIANINDAVFAIWLHISGSPEPRCAPDEYLQTPADVKKLQIIITNFTEWLEQFTGCCFKVL